MEIQKKRGDGHWTRHILLSLCLCLSILYSYLYTLYIWLLVSYCYYKNTKTYILYPILGKITRREIVLPKPIQNFKVLFSIHSQTSLYNMFLPHSIPFPLLSNCFTVQPGLCPHFFKRWAILQGKVNSQGSGAYLSFFN